MKQPYGAYYIVDEPPEDKKEKDKIILENIRLIMSTIDHRRYEVDYDSIRIIVHEGLRMLDPLAEELKREHKENIEKIMTVGIKYLAEEKEE